MDSTGLLSILLSFRDAEDCALSLLDATQESSMKSLEDAFSVALGTGGMSHKDAVALLAALERLAETDSLENNIFANNPELASLKEEVEELMARQNKLWEEQQQVAALRERVKTLQLDLEVLQAKKGELMGEIKETYEQTERLNALTGEERQ